MATNYTVQRHPDAEQPLKSWCEEVLERALHARLESLQRGVAQPVGNA